VGLLSYGAVLRQLCAGSAAEDQKVPVKAIMDRKPLTVAPETPTLEAIRFMREHELSSCPVVKDGELVGIVSVGDFTPIAERLLEEKLAEAGSRTRQPAPERPAHRPSDSEMRLRNGSADTRLF
jgi:Mg/Co/Ni transporter MgtE